MNPEGTIRIRLDLDSRRILQVAVQPRSLPSLNTLLRGKPSEHALRVIPMLFSLCGRAQAAAAATALHAAAMQGEPAIPWQRERLVLEEALQELLWRLLLDLPRILGMPGEIDLLARLRKGLAECATDDEPARKATLSRIEAEVKTALFGDASATIDDCTDADTLIHRLLHAEGAMSALLRHAWSAGDWGDGGTPLMPHPAAQQMRDALARALADDVKFACRPHWSGLAVETGALARNRHHPALASLLQREGATIRARLLARLIQVGQLFDGLRASTPGTVRGAATTAGAGIGWVQTARGLLLHHVTLDAQGMIADYRVVAPTEWNFHPDGAFVRGLIGKPVSGGDEARLAAALLAQSLDPCVPYEIEVHHA